MKLIDKALQYNVDKLLMEYGEYRPLELLLSEGRLTYSDYEAWRGGEIAYLADALFGDPHEVDQLLQHAEQYARNLGLKAEALVYRVWGGKNGESLRFSEQGELDGRFHTGYSKPGDQPQLDLFMDNVTVSLVNGITRALSERDNDEAKRLIDRLVDADPSNARLGGLERLAESQAHWESAVKDPRAALSELRDEIAPLAQDLLGQGCNDFLVPLWKHLSAALQGRAFDPAKPDLHASYTYARALDWGGVFHAVEAERDWENQAALLRRYAAARGHCHSKADTASAWLHWFQLCWRFPDQAEAIGAEAEVELQRAWRAFIELDPELAHRDFPAWLLLIKPGLTKTLPEPSVAEDAPWPETYRIVYTLKKTPEGAGGTPHSSDIEQRAKLKNLNSALFEHYFRTLGGA